MLLGKRYLMNTKKPWADYDPEFEKEILEFCKIHNIKKLAKEYHFTIGNTKYIYSYNKAVLSDMYTGSLPWIKPEKTSVVHIKGNQKGLMDTYMQLLLNTVKPKPLEGIEKLFKPKYPREQYVEEKAVEYNQPSYIKDKLANVKVKPRPIEEISQIEEERPVDISEKFAKYAKKEIEISSDSSSSTDTELKMEVIKKPKTLAKPDPIKIKIKDNPKPSSDKKKQAMDMLLKRR